MIGTTRSRVSFFMNRFRKLGFISYNGRIQVNKSLLNVVLLDQLAGPERREAADPDHRRYSQAGDSAGQRHQAQAFDRATPRLIKLRPSDLV
jgi:hypothetical protein